MSSTVNFLTDISPEMKRLMELKFTIYIDACNIGQECKSSVIIYDNKMKPTFTHTIVAPIPATLTTTTTIVNNLLANTPDRLELQALLHALSYLEQKFDEKTKGYVCVDIVTNSTYTTNVLREWAQLWISDNTLTTRPNHDIIASLVPLIKIFDTNNQKACTETDHEHSKKPWIAWKTRQGNEYFAATRKLITG